MPTIYTIGHSNHSLAHFLDLLKQYKIESVADVRSYPSSRYNPQFNRKPLAESLQHEGINYLFLGDKLGGRREGGNIPELPEFKAGIAELLSLAAGKRLSILCAEEDPAKCHRHKLLEPALRAQGADILNILGNGRLKQASRQLELF